MHLDAVTHTLYAASLRVVFSVPYSPTRGSATARELAGAAAISAKKGQWEVLCLTPLSDTHLSPNAAERHPRDSSRRKSDVRAEDVEVKLVR